jgi:hypothetical protein
VKDTIDKEAYRVEGNLDLELAGELNIPNATNKSSYALYASSQSLPRLRLKEASGVTFHRIQSGAS